MNADYMKRHDEWVATLPPQLTEVQAVAVAETGAWKKLTKVQLAMAQLQQGRLFCNFGEFQLAVDELLGRPTWTHEYAEPWLLWAEYKGEKTPPTMQEILDLLPEEKRILVMTSGGDHGQEQEVEEEEA